MKNESSRSLDDVFYTVGGISITVERVMDLLIGALEGGSNYWYYIIGNQYPSDTSKIPVGSFNIMECSVWGDGSVTICNKEDYHHYGADDSRLKTWLLNEEAMRKGLELMVTKEYIRHFSDFVNEDDDANTADVFFQLSLFGEIIYG